MFEISENNFLFPLLSSIYFEFIHHGNTTIENNTVDMLKFTIQGDMKLCPLCKKYYKYCIRWFQNHHIFGALYFTPPTNPSILNPSQTFKHHGASSVFDMLFLKLVKFHLYLSWKIIEISSLSSSR